MSKEAKAEKRILRSNKFPARDSIGPSDLHDYLRKYNKPQGNLQEESFTKLTKYPRKKLLRLTKEF